MEGQGWAKRDKQTDPHRRTIGWFDRHIVSKNQSGPRIAGGILRSKEEFLVQFGEFDTGGLEDGNAGVRVFPK